jgi:hypothetical protein
VLHRVGVLSSPPSPLAPGPAPAPSSSIAMAHNQWPTLKRTLVRPLHAPFAVQTHSSCYPLTLRDRQCSQVHLSHKSSN